MMLDVLDLKRWMKRSHLYLVVIVVYNALSDTARQSLWDEECPSEEKGLLMQLSCFSQEYMYNGSLSTDQNITFEDRCGEEKKETVEPVFVILAKDANEKR